MKGHFLEKIDEATPGAAAKPEISIPQGTKKDAATKFQPGKKTSLTQKLASGVSKAAQLAKNIETIGTGKWDVAAFAQSILTKELDKGTAKLHTFGKKNYDTAVLGDQIIRSLNMYGPSVEDTKTDSGQAEIPDGKGGTGETTTESFLDKINVLQEKVGATEETKKRRKKAQEKQKTHTPRKASKAQEKAKFKPVGDKLSAKARLLPIVSKLLGKENAEYNTTYITKNFNKVILTIQKMYGPESEYAKEEGAKPLDFTFELPSSGRVADKKKEIKESAITVFLREAVSDDIVKQLGRDGSLELLQGFEKTYPGKQIKFKKVEEEKPKEEKPGEDKPREIEPESDAKMKLIPGETRFLISNPKNFGARGVQYTLKCEDSKIVSLLSKKGIGFLTYLVSKPNELGVRDDNTGTLYVYNKENEPISSLEAKAPFSWSATLKAYKIATDIDQQLGPQADKGEALVSKAKKDAKDSKGNPTKYPFIADYGEYKTNPVVFVQDPSNPNNISKHKIIRYLAKTDSYVFDWKNALPLTNADRNNVILDPNNPETKQNAAVGKKKSIEKKAIEKQTAAGELPLGAAAGTPKTAPKPKGRGGRPVGSKNKPKGPAQAEMPLESKFLEKIEEYI